MRFDMELAVIKKKTEFDVSYYGFRIGYDKAHMMQVILLQQLKFRFFEKHIKSYMNECYEKWPEDVCLRVLFDSAYFWE